MSGIVPAPISPERIANSVIKALDKKEHQIAEYDVFLSYANSDGILAEKIHQALNAKNLRYFMSGKELTGTDIFGIWSSTVGGKRDLHQHNFGGRVRFDVAVDATGTKCDFVISFGSTSFRLIRRKKIRFRSN